MESKQLPSPILHSLLIADQVYQDVSGKYVICGVFNTFYFTPVAERQAHAEGLRKGEPQNIEQLMRAGSPFTYINLTGVHGKRHFELRYVDLADNKALFNTEFDLKNDGDPLASLEIKIALPSLPAPHDGVYALELICDGELLGSHRVKAVHNKIT